MNRTVPLYLFLFSDNIPSTLVRDHGEVHSLLFDVVGGYDRYVHITYELDGNNSQPIEVLNGLGFQNGNVQSIDDVHNVRSCLAGFAAFDKYMSAPEVAGLEVDFYAINHNGWDTASHGISFYFKDANEYAASGLFYATSKAGKAFRDAMNKVGAELTYKTLTVHSVGVDMGGVTAESPVGLFWDLNVTNPAEFVPMWVEFSKNMEDESWNKMSAYGLQTHYLGNAGNGPSHNVWAVSYTHLTLPTKA